MSSPPPTAPTSLPKSNPAEAARKISLLTAFPQIHSGRFLEKVNEQHRELVADVMSRKTKGKIVITLDYAHADGGVEIVANAVLTKAKQAAHKGFLYADKTGTTYQDDPTQTEMEMEGVISFDSARTSAAS